MDQQHSQGKNSSKNSFQALKFNICIRGLNLTHLKLNLQKVEELGTGAVYCQLFDSIYPKSIKMSRVKWTAKHDYDFVANFKLLQAGFDKNGHKKHIEVQKLIKGKYQDNLEFVQWMKALYDMKGGDNNGKYSNLRFSKLTLN